MLWRSKPPESWAPLHPMGAGSAINLHDTISVLRNYFRESPQKTVFAPIRTTLPVVKVLCHSLQRHMPLDAHPPQ